MRMKLRDLLREDSSDAHVDLVGPMVEALGTEVDTVLKRTIFKMVDKALARIVSDPVFLSPTRYEDAEDLAKAVAQKLIRNYVEENIVVAAESLARKLVTASNNGVDHEEE